MVFTFARKALTVAGASAMLIAGLAGQASAANGLVGNHGLCLSVPTNAAMGSPVILNTCNAYEAQWHWGSLGLVQNDKTGLCLEVPNGGGYASLQTCGRNAYQYLDFAPSTGLIGVHSDNRRLLGADGNNYVQSANYGAPNQYWNW
jgi:ricin-type beta-trefoil lectin protein